MILDATIGRDRELEILIRNVTQGHNTLLLGRAGIGKSHLLLDIQKKMKATGAVVYYVRRPIPAKETIDLIYGWLSMSAGVARPRKVGQQTRLVDLAAMIAEVLAFPKLAGKKMLLLIDEFDTLPILAAPTIEVLTERVTLVGAARERNTKPQFNRLFWRFEELWIPPLSEQDSRNLVTHVLKSVPGVKAVDEDTHNFLLHHVAALSSGIPSAIVESVERLRGAERIDKRFVRELYAHRSGNTWFDATPVAIVVFAFLVVMRYVSKGMHEIDMYAIFGALSALTLIVRYAMTRTSTRAKA